MPYGVVWRYQTPESGQVRRLVSAPESLVGVDSVDLAKREGRSILADVAPEHKVCLSPISVVEINEDIQEKLFSCPVFKLPMADEEDDDVLEFVDVDHLDVWTDQPWWFHR